MGDADCFALSETVRKKYYKGNFVASYFLNTLESDGLIEKKEQKFQLTNKEQVMEIFSKNQREIELILSMNYGKGDLVGQLAEQERYILLKILNFGNHICPNELHEDIYKDIESRKGPFYGYSNSSYARKRVQRVTNDLIKRAFLKIDSGYVNMPEAVLTDFLLANLTLTLLNIKQTAERNQQLIEEKALLAKKSNRYNPNVILETVRNNDRITNYVFKGISRIEEGSLFRSDA